MILKQGRYFIVLGERTYLQPSMRLLFWMYASLLSDKTLTQIPNMQQELHTLSHRRSSSSHLRSLISSEYIKWIYITHSLHAVILPNGHREESFFGTLYPRAPHSPLSLTMIGNHLDVAGVGLPKKLLKPFLRKELSSSSWVQWPEDTSNMSIEIVMGLLRHRIQVPKVAWPSQGRLPPGSRFSNLGFSVLSTQDVLKRVKRLSIGNCNFPSKDTLST